MNPGDLTVVMRWPSDAPLRSDLVLLPEGGKALLRRLDPDFARSQRARRLFEFEIRTAAALVPLPALAPITGFGAGEELWLLRPFLEPGSLEERLAAGHLSGAELLTLAGRILAALNALHAAGVTHGDPSPSNVLLDAKGMVRLSDPCSCRRAFVEGPALSPSFGRALDFSRLLSWVEAEASRIADLDGPRIREAVSQTGTVEDRIESLRRTVEGARDSPIRIPFPTREVVPAATRSRVVLSVGRLSDPGSCFRAATTLIPFSNSSVAELRDRLGARGLDVDVEWPEPARQLRDRLLAEGCAVSIRAVPGP
ncbi:MAG: hypothetical protein IT351_02425, partial [Candidatus Fermentibacter sp.]|nr:hypothetical protein [Candidatus Fermentibacter sp.]